MKSVSMLWDSIPGGGGAVLLERRARRRETKWGSRSAETAAAIEVGGKTSKRPKNKVVKGWRMMEEISARRRSALNQAPPKKPFCASNRADFLPPQLTVRFRGTVSQISLELLERGETSETASR